MLPLHYLVPRARRGAVLFVGAVLVACGGSTLSVGTDPGSSSGAASSSSGGASSSGASSSGSILADAGGPCTSDLECGPGATCGFPVTEGCSAYGVCFARDAAAECGAISPGCACDGTEISLICNGLPNGYVPKPLRHTGTCFTTDAGATSCTTSVDCGPGRYCGYPMADACAAKGTCFDAPTALCNGFSPGCACDGTVETVLCTGLPTGYVSKPLLHTGWCNDGGT